MKERKKERKTERQKERKTERQNFKQASDVLKKKPMACVPISVALPTQK